MEQVLAQLRIQLIAESNEQFADRMIEILNNERKVIKVKMLLADYPYPYSKNITDVLDSEFIAEILNYYVGFQSHRNMNNLAQNHTVYQVIMENQRQKLVFEYFGEDYNKLEGELTKMYENAIITKSNKNVVINRAYDNYETMNSEFFSMVERLNVIDPKLASMCREKRLESVNGSDKRAIRSLIEPVGNSMNMCRLVINHIDNTVINPTQCIIGDNNCGDINIKEDKSKTQLHTEWVESNPVNHGELSSQYLKRLKREVVNPLGKNKHADVLKSLGYVVVKQSNGHTWVKK